MSLPSKSKQHTTKTLLEGYYESFELEREHVRQSFEKLIATQINPVVEEK